MGEKWFVCGSEDPAGLLSALRQRHPGAAIVVENDPARLRMRLLSESEGRSKVLVGETETMDPVNLAAAIASDGHASEVLLVVGEPSGSLRSRARTAGIAKVLSEGEFIVDDIDEPVDLVLSTANGCADSSPLAAQRASDGSSAPVKPRSGCPILCIASGRGGVGKTSIAQVMGSVASGWGMDVALVDLDLGSGNLFSGFGLSGPADISPLSRLEEVTEEEVEKLGSHATERLGVWGPCTRPEMAETLEWRIGAMIGLLSSTHDLVICDCSTMFTDAVAQAAQMSDRVLLVADDANPSSGSLSRTALLAVRLGVARTRIARVMNRCDTRSSGQTVSYRGEPGFETARAFRIFEGEEDISDLLAEGRAIELSRMDDAFVLSVSSCLASILSELGRLPDHPDARQSLEQIGQPRKRGLFARMKKAS